MNCYLNLQRTQWLIQDFPPGGGVKHPWGRNFFRFCQKFPEIQRNWIGGGAGFLTPPLYPAMVRNTLEVHGNIFYLR